MVRSPGLIPYGDPARPTLVSLTIVKIKKAGNSPPINTYTGLPGRQPWSSGPTGEVPALPKHGGTPTSFCGLPLTPLGLPPDGMNGMKRMKTYKPVDVLLFTFLKGGRTENARKERGVQQ